MENEKMRCISCVWCKDKNKEESTGLCHNPSVPRNAKGEPRQVMLYAPGCVYYEFSGVEEKVSVEPERKPRESGKDVTKKDTPAKRGRKPSKK